MVNGVINSNKCLLKILFIISLLHNTNYSYSEIRLIIQGNGIQNLIRINTPLEVFVNGVKNNTCSKTCNLQGDKNNITLIFNGEIYSCNMMFYNVNNMIEINLSDFDFSKVEKFNNMFGGCINLKKIEFGNINTSSVTNMANMFEKCSKLTSIDLSKFDTSNVDNMQSMFSECTSLKYLDLSNFNTSKVTSIVNMFKSCSSLIYLNLKSFKLSGDVEKTGVFESLNSNVAYCIEEENTKNSFDDTNINCSNDCFKDNIKIDLENNRYTKNCTNYQYKNICEKECPEGTYPLFCYDINCENNERQCFDTTPEGYYFDIDNKTYKNCYNTCISCYGEGNETINNCIECKFNFTFLNYSKNNNCYERCDYHYYFDKNNKYHCTLNNICPDDYNNLIENKNKCIDNCKKDEEYIYNFDNKCYEECPNDTYILIDDDKNICYNITPEGYYLDIKNNIYKKCYNTCISCNGEGNETINNCIECKFDLTYNNTNCYEKKEIVKETQYDSDKCTDNYQNDFPSETIETEKINNINYTNYNNCSRKEPFLLNNKCVLNCTIIERQTEQCVRNYFNNTDKEFNSFDIIIEQIRNELTNNFNKSVVNNNAIEEKDFNLTITTTNNQKGNIIDFSQCEKELRFIYGINNKNESIYLLRYDIEQDGMYSPLIGYELYYLYNNTNLKKLDLSICKDIKVNITVPINITGNLDKYNLSSGYYNDICYTTDSKYKTDISLNDRKNDYVNNNMSICEIDCDFIAYSYETQNAICSCGIKTEIPLMKNIKFDKEILFNSFIDINNIANIKMMKCYKTVFKKKNIILFGNKQNI